MPFLGLCSTDGKFCVADNMPHFSSSFLEFPEALFLDMLPMLPECIKLNCELRVKRIGKSMTLLSYNMNKITEVGSFKLNFLIIVQIK